MFKVKYKSNEEIERYKARLVEKRFSQVSRIDFTKTFAPTIRQEFLRIFLAISVLLNLILIQINVIDAYLKSALKQNEQLIFITVAQVRQLGRNGLVCKSCKSLYDLKRAEKLWNKTVIKFFEKLGFDTMNRDPCILIMVYERDLIIIEIYIDNSLLGSRNYIALV